MFITDFAPIWVNASSIPQRYTTLTSAPSLTYRVLSEAASQMVEDVGEAMGAHGFLATPIRPLPVITSSAPPATLWPPTGTSACATARRGVVAWFSRGAAPTPVGFP